MSRKKLVIKGMVIIMGVVVIYIIIRSMPYESRYYDKLGITKYRYLYSDMLRDFGEPKEISIYESGAVCAVQDEFNMTFGAKSDDATLSGITITGEKYRFGWRRIGIGSTKDEVLRAYSNVSPCPDPDFCAYVDGDIYVEFRFDDNDIVEEISFHNYALWGP